MLRKNSHCPSRDRWRVEPFINDLHGIGIKNLDGFDWLVIRSARRQILGVHDRLVGELHISCREFLTIMKTYPTSQLEEDNWVVLSNWQEFWKLRLYFFSRCWVRHGDVLLIRKAFQIMLPEQRLEASKEILVYFAERK